MPLRTLYDAHDADMANGTDAAQNEDGDTTVLKMPIVPSSEEVFASRSEVIPSIPDEHAMAKSYNNETMV
eukprot:1749534-Rhodomonas_salina.2